MTISIHLIGVSSLTPTQRRKVALEGMGWVTLSRPTLIINPCFSLLLLPLKWQLNGWPLKLYKQRQPLVRNYTESVILCSFWKWIAHCLILRKLRAKAFSLNRILGKRRLPATDHKRSNFCMKINTNQKNQKSFCTKIVDYCHLSRKTSRKSHV